MAAADFSGGFGRRLNRGGMWSRVPLEHLLVCSYGVLLPYFPLTISTLGIFRGRARVCVCVCCSLSSTSSYPSITASHVLCSWNTKDPQSSPTNNKAPRRIKPRTGGPLLLTRPRILAANRQIMPVRVLASGSMRSSKDGCPIVPLPGAPPCTKYLCLIPASRHSWPLSSEQ